MTVNERFLANFAKNNFVLPVVSSGTENVPNGLEIKENPCSFTATKVSFIGRGEVL